MFELIKNLKVHAEKSYELKKHTHIELVVVKRKILGSIN